MLVEALVDILAKAGVKVIALLLNKT